MKSRWFGTVVCAVDFLKHCFGKLSMLLLTHLWDDMVLPVWIFKIQTIPSFLFFWLFLKSNKVQSEQKSELTGYVRVWMSMLVSAIVSLRPAWDCGGSVSPAQLCRPLSEWEGTASSWRGCSPRGQNVVLCRRESRPAGECLQGAVWVWVFPCMLGLRSWKNALSSIVACLNLSLINAHEAAV